ncbi:MAG TPA: dTMP kinase [Steroidobacteraceae bacterium]|jgi:dTMP kinase|nr:dTMP kinase [Steroidobacteraceae bacterium]
MTGRFLTLEGIEGAGKSTIAKFVLAYLARQQIPARLTREPGGTPLAERIRRLVLERGAEPLSPVTETLLMFAARDLHLQHVIRPALARGEWVVCDRFTDATRAYQGSGRGVDPQLIESLAAAVHGGLAPDCTLLLDVPVGLGLARARGRAAGDADRFEAETQTFFEKVRAGYLELARRAPERFHVIDASAPLAAVEAQVESILEALA